MSSDTCPTVVVKAENEGGCMIINESDFDDTIHELFDEAVSIEPPIEEWLASLSREELTAEAEKHGIEVGNMKNKTIIKQIVESSEAG